MSKEEEQEEQEEEGKQEELEEKKESPRSNKRNYQYKRNENDPRYWPETSPFPMGHDFGRRRQNELWDWSQFRNEDVQALTHTTPAGRAMVHFVKCRVGSKHSSNAKEVLSIRDQEDRAARKFQSLWRARQARLDWKNNKENVLAQAMQERDEDQAARKFQAQWRGRQARIEWKKSPTAVIEKKWARDEAARLEKVRARHRRAEYDSLEFAVGVGNKAHGSASFLGNAGLDDNAEQLLGRWRYKKMKDFAFDAAMPEETLYRNYCSGGKQNQGYLSYDGVKLGKIKKFKGKMAKRMEFLASCNRENLRFAYLSETFTGVSGRKEFEHSELARTKSTAIKKFHAVMAGNLTLVKQKNRGRRPHRKDEEDNWLFLARCSLLVADSPPIDALCDLTKRVQVYDAQSLSDATWITTAKLLASFVSRMSGFWQTTEDMLLSRIDGSIVHKHVTDTLEHSAWNVVGNLLMRRGSNEDEEDTDDNWIPETYLLEELFTKPPFNLEHDDQSLMEEEMKQVRATFQLHGALIKRIFAHYSVSEEELKAKEPSDSKIKPSMDRSEMMNLLADIKIVKTHKKWIKNKQIVAAFNKANADAKADLQKVSAVSDSDEDEEEENPDDELNTTEFVELLLRLSVAVYGKRNAEATLAELFEKLMSNDVRPNAMAADKNIMETALKDPVTQAVFKKNRRMLKRIFEKYAAADASDDAVKQNTTINLEELKQMCRDASLFSSISDRMLRQIFMAAQQDDDEDDNDANGSNNSTAESSDDAEMDVSEFQEFLLAFGLLLEPDPHCHYAKKTERFIEMLVKRLRGTLHKR